MPRPVRPWFRFYVEAFGSRKIRRLTPAQRWVFAAVLGAARESPEPGRLLIAEGVAMTRKELADYADVRQKDVDSALKLMTELGTIAVVDGVIEVRNFRRRQYESDNVTARTRAFRERSNNGEGNDVGTFQTETLERSLERQRNGPETETEAETDKRPSVVGAQARDGAKNVSRETRGSRLAADWTPLPELVEAMRAEGIPDDLARRELTKFRDYWTAQPGAKGRKAGEVGWAATWRNWLRRAYDDGGGNVRPIRRDVAPEHEWMVGR